MTLLCIFCFCLLLLLLFVCLFVCLFYGGSSFLSFSFLNKKIRSETNVQKAIGVIFQSKMLLVFGITFKGGIHAAMGVGAFAGMHPEMNTHTHTRTHARTHARTHVRTHTYTQQQQQQQQK